MTFLSWPGEPSTQLGYDLQDMARKLGAVDPVVLGLANDYMSYFTTKAESYGLPIADSVFRGDLSLDLNIRKRQIAAAGPDGDPRETQSYKLRYKGQWDRIVAYERDNVLIGQKEAEAISRETAIKKGNLQAYEREYVNVPFHKYLVSISHSSKGLALKNWFKARNSLTLKISSRKDKKLLLSVALREKETRHTDVHFFR